MSDFSENLTCFMQQIGMQQSDLAEKSGLTQAAISQLLSGKREPSLETLLKICTALKTTPNDLLGFHALSKHNIRMEIQILRNKIEQALIALGGKV